MGAHRAFSRSGDQGWTAGACVRRPSAAARHQANEDAVMWDPSGIGDDIAKRGPVELAVQIEAINSHLRRNGINGVPLWGSPPSVLRAD